MNIRQWIEHASNSLESAQVFYGHGTDNAHDEAAWLVLHTMGMALDTPFDDWEQELDPQQETSVRKNLAARTENRLPLAYVLGSAWFAGLEFHVDDSVLVPRSPIAELILDRFQPWMARAASGDALDLCTGSGCIGIALAVHMPGYQVDATDISTSALEIAKRNVIRHGVESRVNVFHSDLFSALKGRVYDLIVTNPPYIADSAVQHLPREYLEEPELGLISGTDGLDACLQILLQSAEHLREDGILICEVGESEQQLANLLPQVPFLWLEFENGGSGVFLLNREELIQSSPAIGQVIEGRKHVT